MLSVVSGIHFGSWNTRTNGLPVPLLYIIFETFLDHHSNLWIWPQNTDKSLSIVLHCMFWKCYLVSSSVLCGLNVSVSSTFIRKHTIWGTWAWKLLLLTFLIHSECFSQFIWQFQWITFCQTKIHLSHVGVLNAFSVTVSTLQPYILDILPVKTPLTLIVFMCPKVTNLI